MAAQGPAGTCLYCLITVSFCLFAQIEGKIVSGVISTTSLELWRFMERFCFLSEYGRMDYQFMYPKEYDEGLYGAQNILLYFDDQWSRVYSENAAVRQSQIGLATSDCKFSCAVKESVMVKENYQIVNLTNRYRFSGCETVVIGDSEWYNCTGGLSFTSVRERWWFIVVANCRSTKGLYLEYTLTMLNHDTNPFFQHFSADEFYIIHITMAMLAVYLILVILSGYVAYSLHLRQFYHTTFKLYMTSICLELLALLSQIIYWGDYALSGEPKASWKSLGTFLEFIGQAAFLLMIILMAKGFTITRGRISTTGVIKISVFFVLYFVLIIVILIWHSVAADPGIVLYLYQSVPGYSMIAVRILTWFWFLYAIYVTIKHFRQKSIFYVTFCVLFSIWFLSGVIVAIVAIWAIPAWMREKVVMGLMLIVMFFGHLAFLILTWPTLASKTFPYHIRTSQVFVTNDGQSPYAVEVPATNPSNFQSRADNSNTHAGSYQPVGDRQLIDVFTTSKTHTSKT